MTVFPFHTTPFTKPLIAIISCHGLTDLDSKQFVLPYATVLSVPLPSAAITVLFVLRPCIISLKTSEFVDPFTCTYPPYS